MSESLQALLERQPHAIVDRDGVRNTRLGPAHVPRARGEGVRHAIGSGAFDAVAVELDPQRLTALTDPDAMARMDLVEVTRTGKTTLFAAKPALAAYQRRLAEQLDDEPGAELKRAVLEARQRELPVHLIDRDVGLTFRRASAGLGFWGRIKLGAGLVTALFVDEEVGEADIEKLKQGDMLESSFSEFASDSPELYEAVIAERDRYMAARLRETHGDAREVLAVVGAGHLQGLARHLREETRDPEAIRTELETIRKKGKTPWLGIAIVAFIVAAIGVGIWRGGFAMGADLLLQWIACTAGFAALGCALATAHPLSILTAALFAPLKPFRLGVPTGTFSALTEARIRKPTYADFMSLRDDVQTLRGWYRNRVARVLLTFLLTNLGSMIGAWTGLFRIGGRLLH